MVLNCDFSKEAKQTKILASLEKHDIYVLYISKTIADTNFKQISSVSHIWHVSPGEFFKPIDRVFC